MATGNYKAAFSVTNCVCNDQRVQKIARTLNGLGCRITIIGRKTGICIESKIDQFEFYRFKMLFN